MKKVTIYTDGACRGNPGRGGYGCVLLYTDKAGKTHTTELSSGYLSTTNNRMELMAVIAGLEKLKTKCLVEIWSDSKYVCDAFNQNWIESWIAHNWRTSGKKQVKNVDLWKRLLSLVNFHEVTFHWVKGHADNEYNERCDQLATEAADMNEKKLLEDNPLDNSDN